MIYLSRFAQSAPKSLLQLYAGRAALPGNISLAIGQPSMGPPPQLLEETVSSLWANDGHHGYTPAAGRSDLLKRIAAHFKERGFFWIGEKEVLVSNGAKTIIDVALRALMDDSVALLWFGPGYTYELTAAINGFQSMMIETESTDFLPNTPALKVAIESCLGVGRQVVLVINNPCNPTGRVWQHKHLAEIADILNVYKSVTVVSDETYGDLVDGVVFVPFATLSGMAQRTITICSGSKSLRIPGYRFGFAAAPREVTSAMKDILGSCVGCPNTITQRMAFQAMSQYDAIAKQQLPHLAANRVLVEEWCSERGLAQAPCEGAFYAWVNFAPVLQQKTFSDTIQLADALLEKQSVGIIPGPAFGSQLYGQKLFDSWARISYAGKSAELKEGLRRISSLIG